LGLRGVVASVKYREETVIVEAFTELITKLSEERYLSVPRPTIVLVRDKEEIAGRFVKADPLPERLDARTCRVLTNVPVYKESVLS
jgi:hypothetical protein